MKQLSLLLVNVFFSLCLLTAAYADRVSFLVPERSIYVGQRVSDVGLSEKNFIIKSEAASLYVIDMKQVLNKVATRPLRAGRPIALTALGDPVLVERGQTIKLIFQSDNLQITAIGVVLQSGSSGDVVRVRNADSGRIVMGIVLQNGSVRVGS
ncbi:flagella basal body P-ring formation protein FlgA [Bartonella bacilliformis Peru38]|uniref:flagellar basal body P-ring formation chaperone FlgA n=1 Tax=Bartonella bacilliformis TaxID=774 RepID=UPI00049F9387|nr:flagellar basal body P-ring formation chaperone FlgA [Bartonella bacilliformis]KEG19789.1 flagella basal body P-ring formation protein FlgA [Bartonella bacilliformis Peru38]